MKRLLLKVASLFVVATMFYSCEFISFIENGGGEQETPDKEFKILVSDFGDFDEFAYNENTFVIYNHNDKGLPEWMFTYTYDESTDTEHFEYVVFDERGIPEYYNIDNESIYVDNVRGNLFDMVVIAEDDTFSVVPDVDAGVNLETFWADKGGLTRAQDGVAGVVEAQEIANYAKGGVSFMQGSFEFWGGAFAMMLGCAMLIPGTNVVAGALLMLSGATGFLAGAMHLTMATDLMHSDGTHTEYMEPVADAMGMVSGTVGSYGKPIAQSCAEWCIEKTVDQGLSYFDKRASEVVTYEKAKKAMMMSLQTASYDVDIATGSVTLYGSISGEVGAGDYVGLYVSNEPTAMYVLATSKATVDAGGYFQTTCDGLDMGHTYYYKAYYYSASQDRTYIANTREFVLPGVVTGDYEKVGEGQYRVKLEALLDEEMLNPTVGICWSTNNSTPTTDDSCSTATIIESGAYGAVIEPSKLPCYYRAYIEVEGEVIYGDVKMIAADERDILIQFYRDTGGDNWTRNYNWCSEKPIDYWYGVSVYDGYEDEDGNWIESRSIYISLDGNNLVGSGTLAGMESLVRLNCLDNQLTTLDVSDCTALWRLDCNDNQLTTLNCSGCTALEELYCWNNQLTTLDVSGCTALYRLYCENNQLTSLDVSGCTALEELYCHHNQLTTLNCSGCTALEELDCRGNQLTTLDVLGCTALWRLYCNKNQLTTLDVSGCTALEWLACYNNQLTTLDVSGCTALEKLWCHNNQLTQEITGIFAQIPAFHYDVRYEYWDAWVDGMYVRRHKDNGVGWWYPGEPQRGYH